MRERIRQSVREGFLIALLGAALGMVYTGVTGKGLFGERKETLERAAAQPEIPPEFISYEEALAFYQSSEALFVDARHEYDYQLGHIKGAVNLPLKEYETRLGVLASVPKDKLLVTYCDGEECNSSIELAMKLSAAGYSRVRIFFGGWKEWKSHHDPVEHTSR